MANRTDPPTPGWWHYITLCVFPQNEYEATWDVKTGWILGTWNIKSIKETLNFNCSIFTGYQKCNVNKPFMHETIYAADDRCSEREREPTHQKKTNHFITLHTLWNYQYRKQVIRENSEQWRWTESSGFYLFFIRSTIFLSFT